MTTLSKIILDVAPFAKLNEKKHDRWGRKDQFALGDVEASAALNHKMTRPENNDHQVHRNIDIYNCWKCMNVIARVTMLYLMQDDIIFNLSITIFQVKFR